MRIIINADDFGASTEINLAIAEAFSRGWITNTTIMANMPGFDHAVELSKQQAFFDKVGIHLNFFEGIPLTAKIKDETLFCSNGEMTSFHLFHETPPYKRFLLPKHTRRALYEEAVAQFENYTRAGFTEFHLDSHGHSHTIPSVFLSIKKAIRAYGFKTIRRNLNLFVHKSWSIRAYKALCGRLLTSAFKSTDYFTSAKEFIEAINAGIVKGEVTCEIMVHPIFEEGKLKNAGSVDFEELFSFMQNKELISYVNYGD